MSNRFGFPKSERLKSRKEIDALFAGGKAFLVFPVRTVYRFSKAEEGSLLVGVSASKRQFKRAVDRNRLKRLLREAYRLQKEDLVMKLKEARLSGRVFFLYTDKTLADFETVKTAMAKCLHRLHKIAASENPS